MQSNYQFETFSSLSSEKSVRNFVKLQFIGKKFQYLQTLVNFRNIIKQLFQSINKQFLKYIQTAKASLHKKKIMILFFLFFILLLYFKISVQLTNSIKTMPSYIVRNGKLQLRQADYNIPTYRVIPYKSSINPTINDYLSNTIEELKTEIEMYKIDYRNLSQTMWKIFSQIDREQYDPQISFMGMKQEQIYDKIVLIRHFNTYEPQQSSLRLSAIMKVEESVPAYIIQSLEQVQSLRQRTRQQIRQDSLYEIQEQQECASVCSRQQKKAEQQIHPENSPPQKIQSSNSARSGHRLSLQGLTNHKIQNRRSSILLKEKISIAFHEQQELRQLLDEQLQKITKQLDEKNECLNWAIDELKFRNQLIDKLKETILSRDQSMKQQQQKIKSKSFNIHKSQELIDQKDQQIGFLINQLIERTEQTNQDFEFLIKSIKNSQTKIHQSQTRQQYSQKKNNQSQFPVLLSNSIQDEVLDKVAKSSADFIQLQPSAEYSILKPRKMNFNSTQNITYLTKEHFLQAQKKSENLIIPNIKMTESLKVEGSISAQQIL